MADETAALVQVLRNRVHGKPRTLLQEAVVRLWEAARRELH